MGQSVAQGWEDLFRPTIRHAEVKGVGAEIDFARPLNCAFVRNRDLLKDARRIPGGTNTTSRERRQIDDAGFAVVEVQFELEVWQGPRGRDSHNAILAPKNRPVDFESASASIKMKSHRRHAPH